LRKTKEEILDIPVDVVKNTVATTGASPTPQSSLANASPVVPLTGTSSYMPSVTGTAFSSTNDTIAHVPRRRIGDLVTPTNDKGARDPHGSFLRAGASTISREEGNRLIAVKFGVRGRDLASTVAEAQQKTASLLKEPYHTEWSGEFAQMQEAEERMVVVVALSFVLILTVLYMAFHSLIDAFVVFADVGVMAMGGIWTLFAAGLNFNISAAVGFISILGVAVMDGLLLVSSFNHSRSIGLPTYEAIMQGVEKRIRPVTMTALTAILGLLPAAMSTKIGSQSQRPLAIVVCGGMATILCMFNPVPLLYSLYGDREPPAGSGDLEE
jgi:cobalt-zinc-cadmium resistance protein CzcA